MAANANTPVPDSPVQRVFRTLSSVKTGVVLLIVVGLVAAAGTVILQRPLTDPEQMQRAYSPQTLRVLDALQLTNVYHAWWFIGLMGLVAISIICVSVDRWPNAWRFYARPYRRPEAGFRAATKHKREFPVAESASAIGAAERAMRRMGLAPQRITDNNEVSLFAEKSRFSVFAVYIVHLSLLLIFFGGILDGVKGYRGSVNLTPGESITRIQLRDNTMLTLPFTLRCDGTGQENNPDGSPKRWWSKLVVVENGQEAVRKEIIVNDPLVYKGIRFFQANFGSSNKLATLVVNVTPRGAAATSPQAVNLDGMKPSNINATATIRLSDFKPDAYVQGDEVFRRSNELGNPAIQFAITAEGKEYQVSLLPRSGQVINKSPYDVDIVDVKTAPFTGLEVSYEPGQYFVWGGVILMAIGLIIAFYTFHSRYWAQVVSNGQGALVLWFGAAATKNREVFEQRFRDIAGAIEQELQSTETMAPATAAAAK